MCRHSKRENREIPSVPCAELETANCLDAQANLSEGTAEMNADGKSDESIVPSTQANNTDAESVAESAEERGSAKRNIDQHDLSRTPSRNKRRSLGLAGVREAARNNSELKFTALLHPVSYTHLRAHETLRYLVCRLLLEKKK